MVYRIKADADGSGHVLSKATHTAQRAGAPIHSSVVILLPQMLPESCHLAALGHWVGYKTFEQQFVFYTLATLGVLSLWPDDQPVSVTLFPNLD